MSYTFDGTNKLIILVPGVTTFNAQDLYSRWKERVVMSDNAKRAVAFETAGGEPISDTQSVSPYFFLVNERKVRPHEAAHQLTVLGNLTTLDNSNPFVPTIGDYTVAIKFILSANSLTLEATTGVGSAWTEIEKQTVIDQATRAALNTDHLVA